MLYSRINSSERKYMFLEILQKKRDLKKLVKFSFYIKKVAITILAQRQTRPAI